MKPSGLAILVSGAKKKAVDKDEEEFDGDEVESGMEAVAKELFAAIKDDDEETFVKSFKNACALMKDE